MNDKLLVQMIVLDEIIQRKIANSKFVLTESQDKQIDHLVEGIMDSIKGMFGGAAASPKATGTGKPQGADSPSLPVGDALPGEDSASDKEQAQAAAQVDVPDTGDASAAVAQDPAAQQGVKKGLGAWDTLKQKGLLGGYFTLLQKLMKGYMTILFGTGMWDNAADAQPQIQKIIQAAEDDPSKVPDIMATDIEQATDKNPDGDPKIEDEGEELVDALEDAEKAMDETPPDGDAEGEEGSSAGEGPVPLFKGPGGGLYSKLFSSLRDRLTAMTKDKGSVIANAKINKAAVQDTVKQILKDLSAQLRVNGLKVTESWERDVIALAQIQVATQLLSEAAKNPKPAELPDPTPENTDEFQPGGLETNIPTKAAGRVKPKKGQVEAGRAVGGKVQDLIMRLGGGDRGDMYDDPELRTMVQKNSQKLVTTIITKIVKPYLEPYLKKAGVKLKEHHERVLVQELTSIIMEGINKKINV